MFQNHLRTAWKYTKTNALPQLRFGLKIATGEYLYTNTGRKIKNLLGKSSATVHSPKSVKDSWYTVRDFNTEDKAFSFVNPVMLETAREWLTQVQGVETDDDQLHTFVRTIFEAQTSAGLEPSLPDLPARGTNSAFEAYLDEYGRAFGVPDTIPSGWVGLWIGKQSVAQANESQPAHDEPTVGL